MMVQRLFGQRGQLIRNENLMAALMGDISDSVKKLRDHRAKLEGETDQEKAGCHVACESHVRQLHYPCNLFLPMWLSKP